MNARARSTATWRRTAAVLATTVATLVSPATAGVAAAPAVPALSWTDCGDGLQCATVRVPLDYDHPRGRTIEIGVSRLPATEPDRRIGSLFVNPGGPGESAEAFLRVRSGLYSEQVRARFDIVGMDPRGVGRSTQVRCFDSAEQETAFAAGYPSVVPLGRAQERQAARMSRELAARCWTRNAWLLPHLSTANAARDMDVLRAAVGDERLTYAGYSYGSYLGATYANMFPGRVRALLLDGIVNPARYGPLRPGLLNLNPFLRIRSDVGSRETFEQFLRTCAASPRCALSGGAGPRARFDAVARKLQKHPITVPEPAPAIRIGYAEFLSIFTVVLYRPEFWQLGAQLVADLEAGDGTVLADILRGFTDPINEPQIAILCSEAETVPAPGLVAAAARAAERRAPHFGRYWAYTGQVCASWPRLDQDRYRGPWNRRTSAPALLLTSRYDPATPFHNAVETNRILPGSRLLTVDGYGHTAAGTPSACARQAEQDYVIAGRLPAPGATCPIDTQPFSVNSPASASGAAVRALL